MAIDTSGKYPVNAFQYTSQPDREGHWECSECCERFYTGHENHGSSCSLYQGGRVQMVHHDGPIPTIMVKALAISGPTNSG